MTFYTAQQTQGIPERLMSALARAFDRAAARLAHHRIYRATLDELQALRDRDLADLGWHRSMLKDIAMDAANRKVPLR